MCVIAVLLVSSVSIVSSTPTHITIIIVKELAEAYAREREVRADGQAEEAAEAEEEKEEEEEARRRRRGNWTTGGGLRGTGDDAAGSGAKTEEEEEVEEPIKQLHARLVR